MTYKPIFYSIPDFLSFIITDFDIGTNLSDFLLFDQVMGLVMYYFVVLLLTRVNFSDVMVILYSSDRGRWGEDETDSD